MRFEAYLWAWRSLGLDRAFCQLTAGLIKNHATIRDSDLEQFGLLARLSGSSHFMAKLKSVPPLFLCAPLPRTYGPRGITLKIIPNYEA